MNLFNLMDITYSLSVIRYYDLAYGKIFGCLWLQNPQNKREIICDAKLKTIFDDKDTVGFLEIGKLLTPHFVKTA